jgi:DNA repair exonuclease SbcCD nuclease subunit
MVRFVHTADWQLGMTRHFLSVDTQSRYSEARLEAVRAIGRLAMSEQCAFILVAGDVFETNQVARNVVLPALEAMAACAVPVLLLPGNHDALTAGSVYRTKAFVDNKPANVTVLEASEVIELDSIRIVPATWQTRKPDVNPAETACRELTTGAGAQVLVAHGAVDAVNPRSAEASLLHLAMLEEAVRDGRLEYVALGDQHSSAAVGTTGRIWYSGTPLVTSYRESRPNHVLVVELSAKNVEVHEHVIGDWQFVEQQFDLNTDADVATVDSWLANLQERRKSVVRLSFVGTVSLATKTHLDEVLDRHREVLAALELHEQQMDLAVLPDDADVAALGLTSFAAAALDELVARAVDGPDAEVAEDALGLLYRLARADP